MKAVFVNYIHPDTPHVSAMRMRFFAETFASRGHQVILLTQTLNRADASSVLLGDVKSAIENHDWLSPLLVACRPSLSRTLEVIRRDSAPSVIRRILIFWHYLFKSGLASDWTRGARPYLLPITTVFTPDVIWATFGGTDSWMIARRLACTAGIPWVIDAKDTWKFIPTLFRKLLARRFADASAITVNSRFLAEEYAKWFPLTAEVIYSGVDQSWIRSTPVPLKEFRVMLVGGVYDQGNLTRFVHGVKSWLVSLKPSERVRVSLCYAGSNTKEVEKEMAILLGLCQTDIRKYLPLAELVVLCQGAAVNVYLWSPKTFHHKLVELLCCRRPIISFPGERAESLDMAREVGGSLNVCCNAEELRDTLNQIWQGSLQPTGGSEQLAPLTWSAQTDHLEKVLQRVVDGVGR